MTSLWKKFSAAFVGSALMWGGWTAAGTADVLRKVVIVTRSTPATGEKFVAARIWRSIDGGEWKELQGNRPTIGIMESMEAKCDTSISYKAAAMWNTHTRDISATAPCNEPEVVFNDFIPTDQASIDPAALSSRKTWIAVLGGTSSAVAKGEAFASTFQTAILNGEYGVVAIASSELAAQLRAAGRIKDANIFASLSVDATLSGIAQTQEIPPEDLKNLTSQKSGSFIVLSNKAQKVIEDYQLNDLGISADAQSFGKIDWQTMRSIPGGKSTSAVEWELPSDALTSFDVQQFSINREM
ncbi:hypothetical protein [Sinorhizobium chiapasense]|uniref:Uncharacterized protein n=1 Tax=Sinorhizobium chiapasense TaxID=501572 RepID=A0ABZ2BLI8_9HYPH